LPFIPSKPVICKRYFIKVCNLQRSWLLDVQTNTFQIRSYLKVRILLNSNESSFRLKWTISSIYNFLEFFLVLTIANNVLCRNNIKRFLPVNLSYHALNRDVYLVTTINFFGCVNDPRISVNPYYNVSPFFTIHVSVIRIWATEIQHSFSFDVTKEVEETRKQEFSVMLTLSD
jgi:hypothetical protein